MDSSKKQFRLEFTPEQKAEVRRVIGKDAEAVELSVEELEERIAPAAPEHLGRAGAQLRLSSIQSGRRPGRAGASRRLPGAPFGTQPRAAYSGMPDVLSVPPAVLEELRREVERLRLLHSISLEFNASLDFDELLPRVFDRVWRPWAPTGVALDRRGRHAPLPAGRGRAGQRLVGAQMPVGTGFVGDVAQKQRTTVVTRAREDPRYRAGRWTPRANEVNHRHGDPHGRRGATVGAIQVTDKRTGDGVFDER